MSVANIATNIITTNGAHEPVASIVGMKLYSIINIMKDSYLPILDIYKNKINIILSIIQNLDNIMKSNVSNDIMNSNEFNSNSNQLPIDNEFDVDIDIQNSLLKILNLLKQNDNNIDGNITSDNSNTSTGSNSNNSSNNSSNCSEYITQIDMELYNHFSKLYYEHIYLLNIETKKLNYIYMHLCTLNQSCTSISTIYEYISNSMGVDTPMTITFEQFEKCFVSSPLLYRDIHKITNNKNTVTVTDPDTDTSIHLNETYNINVLEELERFLIHKATKKIRKNQLKLESNESKPTPVGTGVGTGVFLNMTDINTTEKSDNATTNADTTTTADTDTGGEYSSGSPTAISCVREYSDRGFALMNAGYM